MSKSYRFVLLGENIDYSLSPKIFSAMFHETGLTGAMNPVSVSPEQLGQELVDLTAAGVTGLAVTIPHKTAVIPCLDELTPFAERTGAVNSIAVRDGRLVGDNTDGFGFLSGLQAGPEVDRLESALIFGAGGAARAVVGALMETTSFSRIGIYGRTSETVRVLIQRFSDAPHNAVIQEYNWHTKDRESYQLVVNCTPVGGANCADGNPFPEGFDMSSVKLYYDLNYNRDNRLIERVRQSGLATIDGSTMLVAQAIKSFGKWTGRKAPFQAVYDNVFGTGE